MNAFVKDKKFWLTAVVILMVGLIPVVTSSDYILGVLTMICYYSVFAMSWDLLFGYAGEVNFGPTVLIGLGAYCAGMADQYWSLPIFVCVCLGTCAAVVGGLLLAVPALRLTGPYFGLITLVAVLLFQNLIVVFANVTGGEIGLSVPDVLSDSAAPNFYYAFVFMVIAGVAIFAASRSPFGLILQAAGQDPSATRALGFNIIKYKVMAFTISAFFSGMAGALLVFYLGTVSVGAIIDISIGARIIIAVVIGGRRTIVGGVVGSAFLITAGELLRPIGELSTLVVAVIALLVILFLPEGLFGSFAARKVV
jgi:branched-chain amino acid transport system permease protein